MQLSYRNLKYQSIKQIILRAVGEVILVFESRSENVICLTELNATLAAKD